MEGTRRDRLRAYLISSARHLAALGDPCLGEEGVAREAAAAAELDFPRARAPLILLAVLDGGEGPFARAVNGSSLADEARRVAAAIGGADLVAVAEGDGWPEGLERYYWKHLESWRCLEREPERIAGVKRQAARTVQVLVRRGMASIPGIRAETGLSEGDVAALAAGEAPRGMTEGRALDAARAARSEAARRMAERPPR